MIHVAEELWSAWEGRLAEQEEPELEMLFVPAEAGDAVGQAVGAAIREVAQQYEEDAPFVGEWSWLAVSDGVLVQVIECEDLQRVLAAIGADLDRRGVAGTFRLSRRRHAAELPLVSDFIECRIRVRGARERRDPSTYFWHADEDARQAVLAAADRWCRRLGPAAFYALKASTLGPVAIRADEPVVARMSDAVRTHHHAELSGMSGDDYRTIAARPAAGGVSLVAGTGRRDEDAREALVTELVGVLRDQADAIAYGFVRRGWDLIVGLVSDELYDWPRRPDGEPRGTGFAPHSFEDVFAPDAFAVQLLGPGYEDRIPDHPAWRVERAGMGSLLLQHADLAPWFSEPFVPIGGRASPGEASPPDVLIRARTDLAPILYRPGVLHRAGLAPEKEL